jgi:hypothetical protein
VGDDDLANEVQREAQKHIDILGGEVEVPDGVSEEEAVRAVKQQFRDADMECPDDEARRLVRAAWEQSGM